MKDKIVRYDFDPLNPPPLTEEQCAQLARLAAMSDEDIVFSDIPEVLDWSNAERGKFYRPRQAAGDVGIDADVLHWFKTRGGPGYQTRINAALRRVIEEEQRAAR